MLPKERSWRGSGEFSDLPGRRAIVREWQEVSNGDAMARAQAFKHLSQLVQD